MTRPKAYIGSPMFQGNITEHQGFNKQCTCISPGQVIGDVQMSNCIRARQRLDCGSLMFAPRHLQEFDLKVFQGPKGEMDAVVRYIRENPFFEHNGAIAYRFFSYSGETRTVHGVIVTDNDYNLLRRFDREDLELGRNGKSASVLDFCIPYVSVQRETADLATA